MSTSGGEAVKQKRRVGHERPAQHERTSDGLEVLASSFGREVVGAAERDRRVRCTFDTIAPGYDRANDLMSLGLHRRWKARLARLCAEPGPILDLAGGTGDVAARLRRSEQPSHRLVVGADASSAMLALDRSRHDVPPVVACTAEALPVSDASLAAVTLAFGLRNFTDPTAALREIRRVLRPGGRLYLLEFSKPVAAVRPVYRWVSARTLPLIGGWVTGAPTAYRYLVESIDRFPAPEAVTSALGRIGFDVESVERLALGVAAIHVARRPVRAR